MPGLIVNPFMSFGAGGGGGGNFAWTEIAALSAPTAGAYTFSALSLAAYAQLEIYLQGITVGTDETKVSCRLRYGGGPTSGTHKWATLANDSGGSFDAANASGAAEGRIAGNTGSSWALGNSSNDQLTGLLMINNPGLTQRKAVWGFTGWARGSSSDQYAWAFTEFTVSEVDPITEIVILGSNNLTAGKVTLIGLLET